jgi:hypothetical protein
LLSFSPRLAAQWTLESDAVHVGDGDIVLILAKQAYGRPR